jgi:hypothetical protein
MAFMRFTALLIFCLLAELSRSQVLPTFGNSRTATSGMQFLKILPDARGNAMAGSYIAIADDAGAMYWNPAGIALVKEKQLHMQAANTMYFSGFNIASLSAVIHPGKETFWGAYIYSMNSPEMQETTEFQPQGTGRTFRVSNLLAGITYSRILTSSFSFGVNMKYGREAYAGVAINNVMFDLGLNYNVGVKNTRFAVTISNFGLNVQPGGEVKILKFNGEQTISTFDRVSVPAVFRIGAAFDPVEKENHKLTLSAQLNHPTDNNETFSLGAEYRVRKIFFVRSGYEFGQDIAVIAPLGVGVKIPRRFGSLSADYGFFHQNGLGNIHRMTLGISLK